jgi:hypothetical protein
MRAIHPVPLAISMAVALVIAAASVAGTTPPGAGPETATDGQSTSAQALAQASPHLAALRRAATSDDAVPTDVAKGPLLADGVADLSSARRVHGPQPAWIAAARGRAEPALCLVGRGYLGCPPVAMLVAQGASVGVGSRRGEPINVHGIATDDVSAIEVVLEDGTTANVRVENNYFTYDTDVAPVKTRWVGPNGVEEVRLPEVAR